MTPVSGVEERAQANLPVLAVALLVLTTAVGTGLVVADGAFADASRQPGERRAAVALAERLVAADGPLTRRGNVLAADRLDGLNASRLRVLFPVVAGYDVRVRLDDRVLVEAGDPEGGVTFRRVVLVSERRPTTVNATLDGPNATLTLPRRSDRAVVAIDPPPGTTVGTVRANGRVVLHDDSAGGLDGTFRVDLSRLETTRLSVEASGPLPPGSVAVTYYPAETTKAMLVVSVDA